MPAKSIPDTPPVPRPKTQTELMRSIIAHQAVLQKQLDQVLLAHQEAMVRAADRQDYVTIREMHTENQKLRADINTELERKVDSRGITKMAILVVISSIFGGGIVSQVFQQLAGGALG